MVMSMYSLLASNPSATVQDIEDNFDGNICRCTGYRPILSAMKTVIFLNILSIFEYFY